LDWHYLFSNPKVLEAVREEQKRVLGDSHIDLDKLKELELLDHCMTETLRLRPPIILVWRVATSDFKIKDYVVPKGTYVCISPAVQGRSDVFTNPDQFDPWRFTSERLEGKDTSGFYAFSKGTHYCLGEKFAYLQVKTIITCILRKFEVNLIGTEKDYPVDNTTLMAGPIKPVKLTYKRIAK